MEEKIAFVFDTNFIVQNQNLSEVIKKLDNKYIPYVTQVSIEERKVQQCAVKKTAYEKALKLCKEIKALLTIKSYSDLEAELIKHKEAIQHGYESVFKEHIIKYEISSDLFDTILTRAYNKIPPFNDNDKASDKGFKDTLMWLSIIEFFKNNGEDEIVFLTNDKCFTEKSDALNKEFEEYAKKKIKIMENSMFGTLLENRKSTESTPKKEIPNIEKIREQLRDTLDSICWTTEYNYFGDEEYYRGFLTSIQFDEIYIKSIMDNLENVIQDHIFSDKIKVSVFLDNDNRIYNDRKIDITIIEKLNKLYKETSSNFPEHLSALIKTVTEKLNENYEEVDIITDTEVPF